MARSEKEDIKRSMGKAYCLLVRANVTDPGALAVLEEFAIRAINQDRRVGLVLHLGPGVSLDAANTTRTPYIIAGHWEGGQEQFLCPTVGSNEAVLEGW